MAAYASIDPWFVDSAKLRAHWTLGAFLASDAILFGSEKSPPFNVGLFYAAVRSRITVLDNFKDGVIGKHKMRFFKFI